MVLLLMLMALHAKSNYERDVQGGGASADSVARVFSGDSMAALKVHLVHSKCGTAWSSSVLRCIRKDAASELAAARNMIFADPSAGYCSTMTHNAAYTEVERANVGDPRYTVLVMCQHTPRPFEFVYYAFNSPDVSATEFVRDPLAIVTSNFYYLRQSDESWLHVPRSGEPFAGLTFQEYLKSLSDDAAVEFLMEDFERQAPEEFTGQLPNRVTVDYDAAQRDPLDAFERFFDAWALPGAVRETARECVREHSKLYAAPALEKKHPMHVLEHKSWSELLSSQQQKRLQTRVAWFYESYSEAFAADG